MPVDVVLMTTDHSPIPQLCILDDRGPVNLIIFLAMYPGRVMSEFLGIYTSSLYEN